MCPSKERLPGVPPGPRIRFSAAPGARCRFAHRLRRSVRGQSWAEKSLKNGRFLVEIQELRKPQDEKGKYFPRHSPSTLPEWGSGGRWFESSRPDIRRRVGTSSSDWPFLPSISLFRPPGRVEGRDSTASHHAIPFLGGLIRGCYLLPCCTAERDPPRVGASSKHAPWAISNVPRVTCHRHATLNLRDSPPVDWPSLRRGREQSVEERA